MKNVPSLTTPSSLTITTLVHVTNCALPVVQYSLDSDYFDLGKERYTVMDTVANAVTWYKYRHFVDSFSIHYALPAREGVV